MNIITTINKIGTWKLMHVYREANGTTDALAKFGASH